MRQFWKDAVTAAVVGVLLPGVMFHFLTVDVEERATVEILAGPTQSIPAQRQVQVIRDGTASEMALEDYLVGVVLAEMPTSFAREALKAQAVVARTYTLKTVQAGGKHGGAICTDPTCCQAYTDPAVWAGGDAELDKARSAVSDTAGLVLTYEGALIEATYFSCSGGSTEDAVAVWGTDYPYLRATESPGEEAAAYYTDTVTFSAEEFSRRLGLSLTGDPAEWIGRTTYTAGGGVGTMEIGGREFSGTQLRRLLELRSTAFTISVAGNTVCVTTRGYGHRVGMSQYGADAMAAAGSSYAEILAHYYQGTVLANFDD